MEGDSEKENAGAQRFPVLRFLAREWMPAASAWALALMVAVSGKLPHWSESDFEVIFILFALFTATKGLEESGAFEALASAAGKGRLAAAKLTAAAWLLSMFVTNDAAVLVVVPLTLALPIRRKAAVVVLEVLAVNAGSALTPLGNPQNLFIYWHYGLGVGEFVTAMLPLAAAFFLLLTPAAALLSGEERPAEARSRPLERRRSAAWFALLAVVVLAVAHVLPPAAAAAAPLWALAADRRALKVDYLLLVAFFCLFGATDLLRELLRSGLQEPQHVFALTAGLSQFMSNVPATLLVADFTTDWKALAWGANVGGFGWLMGSMASLIAWRIYARARGDGGRFLLWFHVLGFAAFALGALLYLLAGV